jgi:hypothetical protein
MEDGWQQVGAGACSAWILPGDATCAGVARRLFRRTASALRLDAEAIDDGETVVSELAANTLHVMCGEHSNGTCSMGRVSGHHAGARDAGGHGDCAHDDSAHDDSAHDDSAHHNNGPPGIPELWLYLRGSGEQCELVCKVFDSYPGWANGGTPSHGGHQAAVDAMSGRGLEVVHELSHGRWGHHLTRARLGTGNSRGKAVWFAIPAPFAKSAMLVPWGQPTGHEGMPPMVAREAIERLEAELAARGLGDTVVRADEPAKDTAVLSVCGDLTVCCRAGCAWLRAPGLDGEAWGYGDLVEVAEQVIEAHEALCAEPAHTVPASTVACGHP